MIWDWTILGGLASGALAGAGAQYGRLCTMNALERALIGGDFRSAKAWGLALITATLATHGGVYLGLIDLGSSLYLTRDIHWLGALLGGLLFGLGMSLAGTCSFGLILRAGTGDMRAALSAIIVGIAAFAVTSGIAAPLRQWLLQYGSLKTAPGPAAQLTQFFGPPALLVLAVIAALLVINVVADARMRQRPRLLLGCLAMGLAIALGWLATSRAVDELTLDRTESLSFVAPVGRALLQIMIEPFRNIGFGLAALVGVAVASFTVAALRDDIRWEAFDDAAEMRRHIAGAVLMGTGGVLGQGCTIGQGLTAASALAVSAPLFIAAVILGVRIGLWFLIEGRSLFGARG